MNSNVENMYCVSLFKNKQIIIDPQLLILINRQKEFPMMKNDEISSLYLNMSIVRGCIISESQTKGKLKFHGWCLLIRKNHFLWVLERFIFQADAKLTLTTPPHW
jgi:hypothetical protein